MKLAISLDDGRSTFAPGEAIGGTARWDDERTPEWVELRLLWYTEGKGDRDIAVVERVRWQPSAPGGSERFSLIAPDFPLSYSGTLVSVRWALELAASVDAWVPRGELVITPARGGA
jgi:hypothetical protein